MSAALLRELRYWRRELAAAEGAAQAAEAMGCEALLDKIAAIEAQILPLRTPAEQKSHVRLLRPFLRVANRRTFALRSRRGFVK
jgi:hypothetical protein